MAQTIWSNNDLLAAAGTADSGWLLVGDAEELIIMRESTGGTYQLEIEWSRDGTIADVTDVVEFPADDDIIREDAAGEYVRFRVTNAGGAAFTAHTTVVNVRR